MLSKRCSSEEGFHSEDDEQYEEKPFKTITQYEPNKFLMPKQESPKKKSQYPKLKLDLAPFQATKNTIYLGLSYSNTTQIHDLMEGRAKVSQGRPFLGMCRSGIQFDSLFESGNLDRVDQIDCDEFNLYMRIDTNSHGHSNWFYFRVTNNSIGKIKFNICNFTKTQSLYQKGMKPYVKSLKAQTKQFTQQCENVRYFQSDTNLYTLSFVFNFEYSNDQVSFATLPPYTYTRLIRKIQHYRKNYKGLITKFKICTSLSGLQLPLLIITDKYLLEPDKPVVIVTARVHPSETCSSWMMQGFIEFLLSNAPLAQYLRKKIIFKIIPMLNPDGVVVGNYRNGLSGVDLNRQFGKDNDLSLLPEVKALKNLIEDDKSKLIGYFDFHGHQMRKNIFAYGPQLNSNNRADINLIPQILQQRLDSFRLKSCEFGLPKSKQSTARAFANQFVSNLCYTFESSFYGYLKIKNIRFSTKDWIICGTCIGEALSIYLQMKQQKNIKQSQIPRSVIDSTEAKHDSDEESFEESDYEPYEDYNPSELKQLQDSMMVQLQNYMTKDIMKKSSPLKGTHTQQIIKQPTLLQQYNFKNRESKQFKLYPDLKVTNCEFRKQSETISFQTRTCQKRGRTNSILLSSVLSKRKNTSASPDLKQGTIYNFPIVQSFDFPNCTYIIRRNGQRGKKLLTQS